MVDDALAGHIDLIITKSVSRFARNTVDSLQTIRKLKEVGCECFFEKENIWTFDGKGELLLTIMSSLAQEEARNISENVQWGKRRAFEQGKVSMAYKLFLGYEKGADGLPQIVEEEAATVRLIYAMFLEGKTYRQIANHLTGQSTPTPGGKTVWQVSTVKSILQNEKYAGNAILQKSFTVDFLSKTIKVNEGEVPQYFVEDSHPAIITQATFDLAQSEVARRAKLGKQLTGSGSPFTCKVICGACGGFYGPQVWSSTKSYRRVVWQCNKKYNDRLYCTTPHVSEEQLQQAFVAAFNQLLGDKERYIEAFEVACAELVDTRTLNREAIALSQECVVAAELIQQAIADNAHAAQDQSEYQRRYDALVARYEEAKAKLDALQAEKRGRAAKKARIQQFLSELRRQDELLRDFDERAWSVLAESITVLAGGAMLVRFRDGTEITV